MKLPSIVRKLRKLSYYQIIFTLFIIAMITPVSQAYMVGSSVSNFNANRDSHTTDNLITTITVSDPSIKNDIRPEELGFPYSPVTQFLEDGGSFSAIDNLAVDHQFELNLTEDSGEITNSFTINNISDYSALSLQYNITDITTIQDYYPVESTATAGQRESLNWYSSVALAQEFEIKWDYAKFYGAKILVNYLNQFNPNTTYELELLLVGANTTTPFAPNMTDVISTELGGPYNSTNLPPSGTTSNIQNYDFTDVVLEKGNYFIVANLSIIDHADQGTKDYFVWSKNILTPYEGKSFSMDNATRSWTAQLSYDLTLIPELLASDISGAPIAITNPNTIDLQDNGTSITSLTQVILTTGNHILTSNTSVQINFDNNYDFEKNYGASSIISATNSSYWDYDMNWNLTWTTPVIDIGVYINLNRFQVLIAPSDWNATIFTFLYNNTNTMPGSSRTVDGYKVVLNSNNSAGDWKLSTSSPNYVNSLTLSDDMSQTERYFLGYWIGDVSDSYGYGGSNITAEVVVQTDGATIPTNEITGSLNYTLYDINGQIIPIKSSLPANLIYTDSSSYTLGGILNSTAGYYQSTITFDPSASGSDLAGFWTAAVFWQNGTEAGYYSLRIVVQSQTAFEFEWETEPGSDIWTTSDISRIGLDSVLVRGSYYNISEPFTTGTKNLIPSATVSYTVHNATWNDNDVFNDYAPDYNTSILIDANMAVGTYTVDLLGTGAFLENNTASFTLTVFYELSLVPEYTNFQTNYTNNVLYYLNLYDVTASSNLSLAPDDMNVTITNGTDFTLSTPVDYNFTYQAPTEQWILNISTSTNNLYTGLYSVEVSIHLNNYQANYSDVFVSDVYTFEITAPKTSVQEIGDPTTIYLYHDVTYSFRFLDTNHSTTLFGANFVASANVSNIDFSYYNITDTYYVVVTNNNPAVSSIGIYIDISLSNYESVTSFLLGELSVLTIQTSLTEVTTPTEVYVGYTTSIVVQFNDITHVELINSGTGTFVTLVTNSSSYVDLGYVYIGSGQYNVSFINNDFTLEGINITITIGKTGYENASISFQIQVISISTDSMLVDSADQNITIYYDEGVSIEIMYWDNISFVNITNPQAFFSGNLTAIPNYSYLNNITTVTILSINTTGYYELIITITKPGFEAQIITIYILVLERQTSVDSDSTDITFYADLTDQVLLNYTDELDIVEILAATVSVDFAADNSTLTVQDYFIISVVPVGSLYEITFAPIEINATGYVFLFNITLSKYGYEINFIIITVTIDIHPTAIDPSSQDQDSVYTDEDGEFTIIYETVEDDFIGGAELTYSLINGTSADILDVTLTQILDTYVVSVSINSSIVPVQSFLIELTFYKDGFVNQTWIVTITIIDHPTAIDPSSQDETTINTEETGEFTIIYETVEDDFISGAELTYSLINGTSADILDVTLTQILDTYVVSVSINSSIVPVQSFLIELTFYKNGFENQTWIITIIVSIHPTAIDPSSQNQDTIYADEDSELTIIYETIEGDFIPGAEMDYNIINGTSAEILSVTYSQRTDSYVISVYFDETLIAGKNFTIELTFYKHGFENQTWIINISVYEKIIYEINVEIVGTVQQLNTIQFQISLANLSLANLQALSSVDIKYAPSPVGGFVTIDYTFVFSNGTRVSSSIQVEIGSDYTGLSEEIYIPWMVGEIFYNVTYTPTNGAVIESTTLSNNPALLPISPDFATLLTYLFQEFTVYMVIGLALIAILFITLTVYFAKIRPKKQRRKAKKKRYLDKISKILTSVLSLRKVIVVHNETGLPVYEWDLGGSMTVDSSLVSGFLQAVSGMGGEISGGEAQAIRKIDYGQFCVSSSSTENLTIYLFSTSDISVDVEEGLASFISWFTKKFQGTLGEQWDGVTDVFDQASRAIIDRLSEDLFVWTLHPLSVNPVKENDVAKLDSFSQKLYKFIKDYREVTISVSLEYFNKSPIEETLSKLFELVDNAFILRKRLR